MIFSKAETLEDRIVKSLLRERLSIKSLHTELSKEGRLSPRAVYKAVDKLVEAKVLFKAGKRMMVDEEWARRVGEELRPAPMPAPLAGERLAYTLASMDSLDAFWKTTVLPIEEAATESEVFFYNPHDFWAYLPERKESEDAYYKHFAVTKRHGFFVVGGETEADKGFKKEFQSGHLQIDLRNIASLPRTDHITLIGPLIITVRLSRGFARHIDELYASDSSIENLLPGLVTLCRAPGKVKFMLENNPLKAKKLKRTLAKNFYFKLE